MSLPQVEFVSRPSLNSNVNWKADLGMSFPREDKIVIIGGDVTDALMTPNCIGLLDIKDDSLSDWGIRWRTDKNGRALPVYDPGMGVFGQDREESCTPSGGVSVKGDIFLYMSHYRWDQAERQGTHLIKSIDGGRTFEKVWADRNVGSVCPVVAGNKINLFITDDSFKHSNISIAQIDSRDIEKPIDGFRKIIETSADYSSVCYDADRKRYVLAWQDHCYPDESWKQDLTMSHSKTNDLRKWSDPVKVMKWGDDQPWYEFLPSRNPRKRLGKWGQPYGCFFVHDMCDEEYAYVMLSLWNIYDLVIVKIRWEDIFKIARINRLEA